MGRTDEAGGGLVVDNAAVLMVYITPKPPSVSTEGLVLLFFREGGGDLGSLTAVFHAIVLGEGTVTAPHDLKQPPHGQTLGIIL